MLELIMGINIFRITVILIGIIILTLSIYLFISNLIKILRCRKEVEAVVVDMTRTYRNGRIVYLPEIGYIVNNTEYYKTLGPSNNYGIRQHLKIYVNEKNPNIFVVNKVMLPISLFLCVLGLVLCYIGIYIIK